MYCSFAGRRSPEPERRTCGITFETTAFEDNAYLPDFYIKIRNSAWILVSKKIAVQTYEEYYDMQEELEDCYGDLPKSVQNLLEMVLPKAEVYRLGIITAINQKGSNILVEFPVQMRLGIWKFASDCGKPWTIFFHGWRYALCDCQTGKRRGKQRRALY